ncbi:hypothetical protein [Novosphingobium huizhouense]|uniref:hypothetical protein n=1 Tax=Novosphingobium huizhouense TaxID=2866625 RepID=UPI001CD82AEE|nr:hypothetical protein [Novosphingobium huizhouense]
MNRTATHIKGESQHVSSKPGQRFFRWTLALCTAALATHGLAQTAAGSRVLATVAGTPITEAMLKFELGDATLPGGLQAAAEKATLQGLIARRLMADEALRRKVDTTPPGAMALKRADDLALVALLQRSLTAGLPPVPEAEVNKFIVDHPASFARRKRIQVDQVEARNVDADALRQINGLDRIEDITALLDRVGADYIRTAAVLDTLNMEPNAAAAIAAMKRDAVFVTPRDGGTLEISRIKGGEVVPVAAEDARKAARRYLESARSAATAQAQMAKIVAAGKKDVLINPQYR